MNRDYWLLSQISIKNIFKSLFCFVTGEGPCSFKVGREGWYGEHEHQGQGQGEEEGEREPLQCSRDPYSRDYYRYTAVQQGLLQVYCSVAEIPKAGTIIGILQFSRTTTGILQCSKDPTAGTTTGIVQCSRDYYRYTAV